MDTLRTSFRSLIATPGPTLVVVVTLAIAIGANASMFSVVSGVLLRPLGYGDDDSVVVLWSASATAPGQNFRLSPADYRDLRDGIEAFGGQVGLYRSIGSTLTGLDRPVQVGSLTVTPRLFSVLQARPAVGQLFVDADERPGGAATVLLTHASWTQRFAGDPAIVGSSIEIDGEARVVIGITAPGFQFPPGDDEIELYFPMKLSDQVLLDRNHRMFDAVALLQDGATMASARDELDALAVQLAREFPDTNEGWGVTGVPLREELVGDLRDTLWVLSAAVLLVLVTACANVANVMVARSSVTAREFALRAALGARPRDLAWRSLTESLLLGLAGGGLGAALAMLGTTSLRAVIPASIPRGDAIDVDAPVLLFSLLLSVAATMLFGALPAIRSLSPDLIALLKPASSGHAITGGRRLREAMVVLQVAVAVVLLVGAGLMVRSFVRLSQMEPGFRKEGVVSVAVRVPGTRYERSEWGAFFDSFVDRVATIPGVRAAGAVSDLPMSTVGLDLDLEFALVSGDAVDVTARPNADFRLTVPGYFEAMGMRMVAGRDLERTDTIASRTVAVVNETLVGRYFPAIDPIGQVIRVPMLGDIEIVGVVADTRHGGLQARYESQVFVPYGRLATGEMHVVAYADAEPAATLAAMGEALREIDPELAPSELVALEDLLWESVAQPRFNTALLSGLAAAAALLAMVGTYGIVAYSVTRRTAEIGVRMALGASPGATVWLIVRQALVLVSVGGAVGALLALASARPFGRLLFEVPATDPATYAAILASALVIGAVAAWLPARRATRIDPVTALRD